MPTVRTVSSFQLATPPVSVTSLIVDIFNRKLKLFRLEGYCYGNGGDSTTQYFLQCFASATVPANGTAPLRYWMMLANNGFTYDFDEHGLDTVLLSDVVATGNLVFVLSTTQETLTIATGNIKMDLSVDFEQYSLESGQVLSTAGDLTTSVSNRQAFTGVSAQHFLRRVEASNASGADAWLLIFCSTATTPTGGASEEIQSVMSVPNGTTYIAFSFGDKGLGMGSASSSGTLTKRCNLVWSSTPGIYTAPGAAVGPIKITYL